MSEDTPVRRAQLTEAEGCALLKARFEAAGFTMSENQRFTDHGVDVTLDGIDVEKGVGYEFITTAAGDRAEFTPEVVAKLEEAMKQGQLKLLLIDEADVDADSLSFAAEQFLSRAKGGTQ
jgi:hypothetical protein